MRVLFASLGCYLDDSSGAAVASRSLMEALARRGWPAEVVCGAPPAPDGDERPAEWLAERGWESEHFRAGTATINAGGIACPPPSHARSTVRGVSISMLTRDPRTVPGVAPGDEDDLIRLFESVLLQFRPDVLAAYGGNRFARTARAHAHTRGAKVVFPLHNFHYFDPSPFADVDAVVVPSAFAAEYYHEALGLNCTILPYMVDLARVMAERHDPRYVTFVNPSFEKGVYVFARIADELGRRRPDIPLLVVEGRGTETTLAGCGLDLRVHGNVNLMAHTPDPRRFWGVTRIALVPSLWWENQPLVAVEAMINGIPVIGSDRGGLPETLSGAGVALPLPQRLTPATRMLPTAEEVAPWVVAIIRLWDDPGLYDDHRRRSLAESRRWDPEVLEPQYVRFFREVRTRRDAPAVIASRRTAPASSVVLVPHFQGVEPECQRALCELERAGVKLAFHAGSAAIDQARSILASDALHDGAEAMLFVDADLAFNPLDALRLLARSEPVIAGVYAKKGPREMACRFAEGVEEIVFGERAFALYPLQYAATGFLRIRASVLRRMIDELRLPLCNTAWGRGFWPFFQPIVVESGPGGYHYLGEDWAFSHRLSQIGITPLADTSIRLWHLGRYAYGWEDAGSETARYPAYVYRISQSKPRPPSC